MEVHLSMWWFGRNWVAAGAQKRAEASRFERLQVAASRRFCDFA
ncbi:MAG: hypothetical protein AAGF36_12195 [Pseudomonadota bacterium]